MSRREEWGQVLGENAKHNVSYYIGNLSQDALHKIRTMIVELSLDVIEEPNKPEYEQVLRNFIAYNHAQALRHFLDVSGYWWHIREWARFIVGHHRPVPNADFNLYANFAKHFPHISREDDKRVAVVMDNNKAHQDLHTSMKIGRYLSKQTDAPESAIPDISNEYANRDLTYHLEVARTPAEIQWVYENGPTSCMGKTINEAGFYADVHPTHAYATPDICVLYVKALDNPNRVIARTVASTINHTYVRIFGNAGVIDPLLNADKWKCRRTRGLDNHRLRKITQTHQGRTKHIGPYLDSGKYPIYADPDDDQYLIINPTDAEERNMVHVGDSEISYSQKGFIDSPPLVRCYYCNGRFQESDLTYYDSVGDHVCGDCRDENMRPARNRYFEEEMVDYEHVCFDVEFVIDMHRSAFTAEITGGPRTQTFSFIDENEFLVSDYVHYRDEPNLYLMVDSATYIDYLDTYVYQSEATQLDYSYRQVVKTDLIRINNRYYAEDHIEKGRFKYTTNNGFDIPTVIDKLHKYYFKYNTPIESDTLRITHVSDVPKSGYTSLQDYWNSRTDAYFGTDNVGPGNKNSFKNSHVDVAIVPTDYDGKLFKSEVDSEYEFFTNSTAAYTRRVYITDMKSIEQLLEDRMIRLKPIKKKRRRKRNKPKKQYVRKDRNEQYSEPAPDPTMEEIRVESYDDLVDSAAYTVVSNGNGTPLSTSATTLNRTGGTAASGNDNWINLNTGAYRRG